MKLFVEYAMLLAGTLAVAMLVAFGEPAQADLRVVDAASTAQTLFDGDEACSP